MAGIRLTFVMTIALFLGNKCGVMGNSIQTGSRNFVRIDLEKHMVPH